METVKFMPNVVGKYGCEEEKKWPVTFGMNKKGGMTEDEFWKYLEKSVFPLHPDAKDKPSKRVIQKVDSGPGRLGEKMLASARLRGFILYPGVPNTTGVSQETDRN